MFGNYAYSYAKSIYQPEYENKKSWRASILNSYRRMMREFPLPYKGALYKKYYLKELDLQFIYQSARVVASDETGKALNTFPLDCPWDKNQLMDFDFILNFIEKYCPNDKKVVDK